MFSYFCKIIVKIRTIPVFSSLSNLGWGSSDPAAFEEFKCNNSVSTLCMLYLFDISLKAFQCITMLRFYQFDLESDYLLHVLVKGIICTYYNLLDQKTTLIPYLDSERSKTWFFSLQDIIYMIYGPVVKCQYCFASKATSNVRFSERTTPNRRLLSNFPRFMMESIGAKLATN